MRKDFRPRVIAPHSVRRTLFYALVSKNTITV